MNVFECLSYMSYMYMRKHHKEDSSVRRSSPEWKDTFAIDDKGGEIYQMQRTETWFQGKQWSQRCKGKRHVSRGSMSDMISVLHHSVSINAKGEIVD
jgi:hypothetical protein